MQNFYAYILNAIIASTILACNQTDVKEADSRNHEVTDGEDTPNQSDSALVIPKDSIKKLQLRVYGLYTGTVPCADCKETRLTVILTPRGYHLLEEYPDKSVDAFYEEEGYWRFGDGIIRLQSRDSRNTREFEAGENSIRLIWKDESGEQQFVLQKKVIGADNKAWMEKKKKGIDFIALGNEPFWALDLDKEKKISFLIANDMRTIDFPWTDPVNYQGTLLYSASSGNNRLKLSINPTFCGDGMSDRWYEYEVKAELNDTLYKGCGVALRLFY